CLGSTGKISRTVAVSRLPARGPAAQPLSSARQILRERKERPRRPARPEPKGWLRWRPTSPRPQSRRRHATRCAVEQADSEALFELPNGVAERARGEPKLRGGLGEAAAVCDCHKSAQLGEARLSHC